MPRPKAATFQGEPCKAGHSGERYSSNRACVQCALDRRRATYDTAAETAYKRDYRARQRMAGQGELAPVDAAGFGDLL